MCKTVFIKGKYIIIVQNTELLHLLKSNESLIIRNMWWCDGSIILSNHELEDVGMVFPHNFTTLEFRPSAWLFVHLSVSV